MKIITSLVAAAGFVALAACGGGAEEANTAETLEANTLVVDNLVTNDMNMDMNMGMNATDNAVATDLTTNTPDANLSNGM